MSARTKSERLRRLISHGYFAPELPPCFVSEDLAKFRRAILTAIDALPPVRNAPALQRYISEPTWFYFPRFGKEDRRHGVPNPIAHLLLARVIADNYVALRRNARASALSLSPPVFDWNGPRALVRPSVDLRDDFRVELSSRREEYTAADVRAFFHSIYTHSIPWAVHGKAFAKQNRGLTHYGNLIDLLCRNAQDGQTIGLPVGPDTSRLLAELVASAMDVELQANLGIGRRDASRYVDDYTISSATGESGQVLLANLRQVAAAFELELNNTKSGTYATSDRQNTGWQQEALSYIPRESLDEGSFKHFFYQLGRLCLDHPDINVEKFGLQNARSVIVGASNWGAAQSVLISAYRRNASLISLLVEVVLLRHVGHSDVGLEDLREFIENRIPVLARADRMGEIAWLLFLALRLVIQLSARSLELLFHVNNALVALLIASLDNRGLVRGAVDRSHWNTSLDADGLRSSMWLYAYEATTMGLIPGVSDTFITQDPYFSLLRLRRIQFLSVERGFTSINARLRDLRNVNERFQRLRAALQDSAPDDQREYEDQDDDGEHENESYESLY